jgi:hypothetical protein
MSDPSDVLMAPIRSTFESYPKECDPEWRSPNWIMPEECARRLFPARRRSNVPGADVSGWPSSDSRASGLFRDCGEGADPREAGSLNEKKPPAGNLRTGFRKNLRR